MVDFKVMFDGLSVSEMKDALKALNVEAKAFIKAIEVSTKDQILADAKASIKAGDIVTVKYKDETITGEVVECRDKTFSIMTSDILNIKGEPSKIARAYNLLVQE